MMSGLIVAMELCCPCLHICIIDGEDSLKALWPNLPPHPLRGSSGCAAVIDYFPLSWKFQVEEIVSDPAI
jgi:hypothetical protein